jgi:hypothetical protein
MGILASDEILLSERPIASYHRVQTVPLNTGGWVEVWSDRYRIDAQLYNGSGVPIGNPISILNDETLQSMYPTIVALSSGGWLCATLYEVESEGELHSYFRMNSYDAAGSLIKSREIHVQGGVPQVFPLSDGGWLVSVGQLQDDGNAELSNYFYNGEGELISETQMSDGFDISAFGTEDGGYLAIHQGYNTNIQIVERFDAQGRLVLHKQYEDSAVQFLGSSYGVSHYSYTWGDTETKGQFNFFDLSGNELADREINISLSGLQPPGKIMLFSSGLKVHSWFDSSPGEPTILFQMFDEDGNPISETFARNLDTSNGQISDPHLRFTELSTGQFVATWQEGNITSFQQLFNADGTVASEATRISEHGLTISSVQSLSDGGWRVSFYEVDSYATDFGPPDLGRTYIKTFHPNDINNAPVAVTSHVFGDEDTALTFGIDSFLFYDADGDAPGSIKIESLPTSGVLTYDGKAVTVGQIFDATVGGQFAWAPAANVWGRGSDGVSFSVTDEAGIGSSTSTLSFDIRSVNDRPVAQDRTITILEDQPYTLALQDFGFSDIDGDELFSVLYTHARKNGDLYFEGSRMIRQTSSERWAADSVVYVPKQNLTGRDADTIKFIVGDDSESWDSNLASDANTITFNIIPVNDAPEGMNRFMRLDEDSEATLGARLFPVKEDVENHHLKSIIIEALPEHGRLVLHGRNVQAGDEIAARDLHGLIWRPEHNQVGEAKLSFRVRDDGGTANGGDDISDKPSQITFFMKDFVDTFKGGSGNDRVKGSDGRDIMYGFEGKDVLICGLGDDKLYGGDGRDRFVFTHEFGNYDPRNLAHNSKVILDFDASGSDHDVIDLRAFHLDDPANIYHVDFDLDFNEINIDVWANGAAGVYIVLKGVDPNDIRPELFLI